MQKAVLDTNIFIYLANGRLKSSVLKKVNVAYASITKIEALGYGSISTLESAYLKEILDIFEQHDLTSEVIDQAINLRIHKRMSLGDAIVAATALYTQSTLWTANTKDFQHIHDLKLFNPIA